MHLGGNVTGIQLIYKSFDEITVELAVYLFTRIHIYLSFCFCAAGICAVTLTKRELDIQFRPPYNYMNYTYIHIHIYIYIYIYICCSASAMLHPITVYRACSGGVRCSTVGHHYLGSLLILLLISYFIMVITSIILTYLYPPHLNYRFNLSETR